MVKFGLPLQVLKKEFIALERASRRATKFILKWDLTYPLELRRKFLDLRFFFKQLTAHIDFFKCMEALNRVSTCMTGKIPTTCLLRIVLGLVIVRFHTVNVGSYYNSKNGVKILGTG